MTAGEWGGHVIDGRFELLQQLGGGGMGLVWRARDNLLHREVALKEVRAPDAGLYGHDASAAYVLRERVLREAQALARLHHPNVVTIHHIVDSTELAHPWLVMELVTGGSLHDRLNQGPLSHAEAVKIARGILAALRAAHAAGIQHRDVKPANVLLRPDGTPVLTDFGIAALQESPGLTATGMMIGSPEYMAPERIHGKEGDPASDLWSLGLLLYAGLEGFNPLRRETTIATIAAVAEGVIPPPTRSGPLVPVLSALLVRDPAYRVGAEQLDRMLAEIERALADGAAAPGGDSNPTRPMAERGWPSAAEFTSSRTAPNPVANPYGGLTEQTQRSKPRVVSYVVSGIAAVALSGGMMWFIHHVAGSSGRRAATSVSQPAIGPGVTFSTSNPDDPQTPAPAMTAGNLNLLTPAGMRSMLGTVNKVTGGTKIVRLVVYPTYADIEAVKASDHTEYDNFSFRDGKAAFESAGGTLDPGDHGIDPATVNWDALPALMKKADAQLKVAHPKDHYVVLDSDIITYKPEFFLYVSDDYGSGYLQANLDGTGVKLSPKS
jgi:serine/threonine protein kinase